jgi:hypothetical protein
MPNINGDELKIKNNTIVLTMQYINVKRTLKKKFLITQCIKKEKMAPKPNVTKTHRMKGFVFREESCH